MKEAPKIQAFQMDVTKKEDIQRALQVVSSRLSDREGLWALINNAGIVHIYIKRVYKPRIIQRTIY